MFFAMYFSRNAIGRRLGRPVGLRWTAGRFKLQDSNYEVHTW